MIQYCSTFSVPGKHFGSASVVEIIKLGSVVVTRGMKVGGTIFIVVEEMHRESKAPG